MVSGHILCLEPHRHLGGQGCNGGQNAGHKGSGGDELPLPAAKTGRRADPAPLPLKQPGPHRCYTDSAVFGKGPSGRPTWEPLLKAHKFGLLCSLNPILFLSPKLGAFKDWDSGSPPPPSAANNCSTACTMPTCYSHSVLCAQFLERPPCYV